MSDLIRFSIQFTIFSASVALVVRLYLMMTAAQRYFEEKTRLTLRQHRELDTE